MALRRFFRPVRAEPTVGGVAWKIRSARPDDIEAMQAIERDAGRRFRDVGLDRIADDHPPSADELAGYVADGRAWMAAWHRPVGYALASVVDGEGHLDQVSVIPAEAGQAIGRDLVEEVHRWARDRGLAAVTLTTFADVPWNGPYYARMGYEILGDDELGPELAAIRAGEQASGLDVAPRVAMRLRLADAADS